MSGMFLSTTRSKPGKRMETGFSIGAKNLLRKKVFVFSSKKIHKWMKRTKKRTFSFNVSSNCEESLF